MSLAPSNRELNARRADQSSAALEVAMVEHVKQLESDNFALKARLLELEGRINTPHTDDWFEAVRLEAAHQVERFGSKHDAGKAPTDWLWLIGWLVGKACTAAVKGDTEKAKHHTVSTGACLLNWHRSLNGDSAEMRPGIADPEGQHG
jgi:hypothetical protein